MKKFAAAMICVAALPAWASAIRAADVPADNSGKNVRDRLKKEHLTAKAAFEKVLQAPPKKRGDL